MPESVSRNGGKPSTKRRGSPGRPSTFSRRVAERICARLAQGESLRSVCRDDGMPPEATFRRWVLEDVGGIAAQYARARQVAAMGWADEILDIADDGSRDTVVDDDGGEKADHEWIQRSRLRVETRKWLLSKMLPKVYGDRLELEHGGKVSLEQLVAESMHPEPGAEG